MTVNVGKSPERDYRRFCAWIGTACRLPHSCFMASALLQPKQEVFSSPAYQFAPIASDALVYPDSSSPPINILGDGRHKTHLYDPQPFSSTIHNIGRLGERGATPCDEDLLDNWSDSEVSDVNCIPELAQHRLQQLSLQQREDYLKILEEEFDSRSELLDVATQLWHFERLSQRGRTRHDSGSSSIGGLLCDIGDLTKMTESMFPLGGPPVTENEFHEQQARFHLQAEAEQNIRILLHRALVGVEQILEQQRYEHASRMENFHRVTHEKLRHHESAKTLMEDRGRELADALQQVWEPSTDIEMNSGQD